MRKNGLFGKQAKHKYHSYKGDNGESKENLLLVKEENKNTHISEDKLYLSPIMDMYDGSIISYDISMNPNFK